MDLAVGCVVAGMFLLVTGGLAYHAFVVWTGQTVFEIQNSPQSRLPLGRTKAREAWCKAAGVLRLRWAADSEIDWSLSGPLEGRRVAVAVCMDPPQIVWRVSLRAPLADPDFRTEPGSDSPCPVGDRAFDRRYRTTGQPEYAGRLLTAPVRRVLVEQGAILSVDGLEIVTRELPSRSSEAGEIARFVRTRLEPLMRAADQIDNAAAHAATAADHAVQRV